ncbi:MAG: hypothetical protein Q8922_09625 [Bacteroidota bacterium]|nr:hypothetical protein [Bacteroidota bacterium]MDP4243967.1 hypothetical protein [Bacteroidota bacterium]MDP4288183.1 hypothetical protein [Bacteroidota bacterium]
MMPASSSERAESLRFRMDGWFRMNNDNAVRRILVFLLTCFLLPSCIWKTASAQENATTRQPTIELHGYVKSLSAIQFQSTLDSAISSAIIHNRLTCSLNISNALTGHLEVRNRIFYGEDVKLMPGFGNAIADDPGYLNLSVLWVDARAVVVNSIADRAYVKYDDGSWDFRLGRQRINWGINTIWNPNDLFNAYNFLDFDYEERPGTDAIRAQYSLGTNASAEADFAPSRIANNAVAAALIRWNVSGYDLQVLAGMYRTDFVAGFGWAGSIAEAGFKGELSYFHPRSQSLDSTDAFEASLTLDHTLGQYYLVLSGLYNSLASNAPEDFSLLSSRALSPKNLMPFRYTVYASGLHSFSPLVSASVALIYSPRFNSTIFFPMLTYSLAQDVDADLVAESYFNDASGAFRTSGNALFLRIRLSF